MKRDNIYRVVSLVLSLVLLLSVATGCGKKEEQQEQLPEDQADVPVSNPVDFDLEAPQEPAFDDITLSQEVGITDGLYTIENGVAYALDPDTLEKTGPALDPITHEPLEQDVTELVPIPDLDVGQETTEEVKPSEPTKEETTVPEEVKLPNTGIFLEDD